MSEERFDEWAVLELMGHRRLAGKVSEATIAGGAFLRIEIPNGCTGLSASWCPNHGTCTCAQGDPDRDDRPTSCLLHSTESDHEEGTTTQFYAPGSVYAITLTTEELARGVAARNRPESVHAWELRRALPAEPRDDYDEPPF